jgi:hypothetical protein
MVGIDVDRRDPHDQVRRGGRDLDRRERDIEYAMPPISERLRGCRRRSVRPTLLYSTIIGSVSDGDNI